MSFTEIQANLFEQAEDYALAHCVGNDFIMGAGIAVEFKTRFGHVDWLKANSQGVGTTLLLQVQDAQPRSIFYLISKPWSRRSKPTYENLKKCIISMFEQAKTANITKIAMPKLGCGLDGKDWTQVRDLLKKHQPKTIDVLVTWI